MVILFGISFFLLAVGFFLLGIALVVEAFKKPAPAAAPRLFINTDLIARDLGNRLRLTQQAADAKGVALRF